MGLFVRWFLSPCIVIILNDDTFAFCVALQVLCYLAPLFPKNVSLFWQDEVNHYAVRIE